MQQGATAANGSNGDGVVSEGTNPGIIVPGMIPGFTPPNVIVGGGGGGRRPAFSFDTIPQGEHRTNPVLAGIQLAARDSSFNDATLATSRGGVTAGLGQSAAAAEQRVAQDSMQLLAYAAQHRSGGNEMGKPKGAMMVL